MWECVFFLLSMSIWVISSLRLLEIMFLGTSLNATSLGAQACAFRVEWMDHTACSLSQCRLTGFQSHFLKIHILIDTVVTRKMESVWLLHSDIWATVTWQYPHNLEHGPPWAKIKLLYNVLASCQLCTHLVHKGVGTSRGVTGGLQCVSPHPRVTGMADIPTAPQTFFCPLESCVNLPDRDHFRDSSACEFPLLHRPLTGMLGHSSGCLVVVSHRGFNLHFPGD